MVYERGRNGARQGPQLGIIDIHQYAGSPKGRHKALPAARPAISGVCIAFGDERHRQRHTRTSLAVKCVPAP
jgi:hypothetical protein